MDINERIYATIAEIAALSIARKSAGYDYLEIDKLAMLALALRNQALEARTAMLDADPNADKVAYRNRAQI